MSKEKIALVTFGLGGHTAYPFPEEPTKLANGATCTSTCTIHGYNKPENFVSSHEKSNELPLYQEAIFLNLIPAVEKNPMWAIGAPMVSTSLKGEEVDRCPEPFEMLMAGLGGQFKTMMNVHQKVKDKVEAGLLDSVSVNTYVNWWVSRGAVAGSLVNGEIVWTTKKEKENVQD